MSKILSFITTYRQLDGGERIIDNDLLWLSNPADFDPNLAHITANKTADNVRCRPEKRRTYFRLVNTIKLVESRNDEMERNLDPDL